MAGATLRRPPPLPHSALSIQGKTSKSAMLCNSKIEPRGSSKCIPNHALHTRTGPCSSADHTSAAASARRLPILLRQHTLVERSRTASSPTGVVVGTMLMWLCAEPAFSIGERECAGSGFEDVVPAPGRTIGIKSECGEEAVDSCAFAKPCSHRHCLPALDSRVERCT